MRRVLLVTGTRNRREGLRRLCASIQEHATGADARLWIANAGSYLGTVAHRGDRVPVNVWEENPPRGFGPGLNALIARAYHVERSRGWGPEYVLWLNDDATVEPGFLEAALRAIKRFPHAGMVALPYLTPHDPAGWHINLWPTPTLPYANFGMLSLDVFWRIGGFDERVRLYGGDNSLAFRVFRAGLGIVPAEHGCIVHHFAEDEQRQDNKLIPRSDWSAVQPEYMPHVKQYEAAQNTVPPEAWARFDRGPGCLVLHEKETTTYQRHMAGSAA